MKTRDRILGGIVGALLMLVLAPILLPLFAAKIVYRYALVLGWHARHGRHGRRWLAVYSDSAKWKQHFETGVLPSLSGACIVINISKDSTWKNAHTLERRVHQEWGGRDNHTPILLRMPGIVGRVEELRFYEAYLAHMKGHESNDLAELLSQVRRLANEA